MDDITVVTGGTGYKERKITTAVISDYHQYEVKDWELKELMKSDVGLWFNIALSALSACVGILVTILASPPANPVIGAYLKSGCAFTFLLAIAFFLLSHREKSNREEIYQTILKRAEFNNAPSNKIANKIDKEE